MYVTACANVIGLVSNIYNHARVLFQYINIVSFLNVNSELLETYSEPTRYYSKPKFGNFNYSKPLENYSARCHH